MAFRSITEITIIDLEGVLYAAAPVHSIASPHHSRTFGTDTIFDDVAIVFEDRAETYVLSNASMPARYSGPYISSPPLPPRQPSMRS